MMTLRTFKQALLSFNRAAVLATVAGMLSAVPMAIGSPAGQMGVYQNEATGEQTFSLSLSAPAGDNGAAGREVVVLFDTSASQTGMYREGALAALESLAAKLRPEDQVRVAAVDLEARPMNEAAAAGGSVELAKAIAQLHQESPLGTTDLIGSLNAATEMFSEREPAGGRVVIYIGDGMSNANFVSGRPLEKLVSNLRQQRISVSSFAIGPDRDNQLLAVLANHTGGNLYVDAPMARANSVGGITRERATQENLRRTAKIGGIMADWVRATVYWPEQVVAGSSIASLYPANMPALRSDRDTVVVGTLSENASNVELSCQLKTANGDQSMQWTSPVAQSLEANAYLAELVNSAKADDGLTLPTVGTAGLVETGRMLAANVDGLTDIAERAVSVGDNKSAMRIANAVLRRDPGNLRAQTVQRVVRKGGIAERRAADAKSGSSVIRTAQQTEVLDTPPSFDGGFGDDLFGTEPATEVIESEPVQGEIIQGPVEGTVVEGQIIQEQPQSAPAGQMIIGDSVIVQPEVVQGPTVYGGGELIDQVIDGEYPPASAVTDGVFLNGVERRNRVFAQMLEKEVQTVITEARDRMTTAPDQAIQQLKLAMQNVENAPELLANVRASLVDRLETALREASRAAVFKAEVDRQREEAAAAARERKLLLDRLDQQRQREKQLMARFNSLMDERRYAEAEEVAEIVAEIDPDGVTPVAASLWAAHSRADYYNNVYRAARAKAFIDTLLSVEMSAIPFSDQTPIVYPAAEVWQELTDRRLAKYGSVDIAGKGDAEIRINNALQGPLTSVGLDFPETPLEEVIDFLRDEYNVPIQLDAAALDELGISPDDPVNVNLNNVSLRSALRIMLKPLDLTYIIEDEVLLITTEEYAETRLVVKVYPVGDLVIDKTPLPVQGGGGGFGGGGGGGLGGGGGGGLGGGGGGGLGGGGGGFGGGGGGQFSVPDPIDPSAAPASDAQPTQPQPSATSTTKPVKAESSIIAIDENVAPAEFWNEYFSAAEREAAPVRSAARKLMRQKKYAHVIELVHAALRNGQSQSWMYEALGIAMKMDGRDEKQIARAVMSAADFSTSADELMLIANYMLSMELDKYAIQLYRQVVRLDPLSNEAHLAGLRAAQRTDDLDGIVWATEGILSRAWPAELATIEETAMRVAKATIRKMDADGMTDDLADYRERLTKALVRDCVIQVSWTGNADVDLLVEEPGGTVCSPSQPQTASGGMNLGDTYASGDASMSGENNNAGGFSETYVCPKGFSGEYRVRIRKVWGEVTAGKVTVDVVTGYRTDNPKHERQQIDLGEKDSIVLFELKDGRRAEPIEDRLLAGAIEQQQAIGQAVLAQQIDSLSDPQATPLRPQDRLRRLAQLNRGGAVGFQPQIITLPTGTSLTANAVASADRRYVIVRPSPLISAVTDVTSFTFAGGGAQANGNQQQNQQQNQTVNNTFNFAGAPAGGGADAGGAAGGGAAGGGAGADGAAGGGG